MNLFEKSDKIWP